VLGSIVDNCTNHTGKSSNKKNDISNFSNLNIREFIVFEKSNTPEQAYQKITKTQTNNYYIVHPH
jgi:hypothetical protein